MQAELAREPSIPSPSRQMSEESSSAAHIAVAAAAAAATAVAVPPTQAPSDSAQKHPLMPPSNDVTAPHSALPSGDAAGQARAQAQAHINAQPSALATTVRPGPAAEQPLPKSLESATGTLSAWAQSKMIFSDLYKSGKLPLTKLRSPPPHPLPTNGPEYDADLVSRDKTKQKEAVKKYLAATIRSDWAFTWPPPAQSPGVGHVHADTEHPGDNPAMAHDKVESREHPSSGDEDLEVDEIESADDTASVYSTVSDDPAHFKVRAEWTSDLSDDDDGPVSPSAYRFDSPDTVGSVIKSSGLEKRAKRRKAVREEEAWNAGLACFNARRDAWTSAKTARVKPKPPVSPMSSASRRLSFWRLSSSTPPVSPTNNGAPIISPLSPTTTHHSGDSTAVASSSDADSNKIVATRCDSSSYPVETLLPIPPPLLPPANPMRASITPATYPSIYDRIVVHSMTPACPVNLGDVLRACVAGWKRDGEWPPRATEAPTSVVAIKKKKRESNASHASAGRRMSLGFLGRRESATAAQSNATSGTQHDANGNHEDGAGTGKGIRRSIQKVLGLGHERRSSAVGANGVPA